MEVTFPYADSEVSRILHRIFQPGDQLPYSNASKISNFQSGFDNGYRNRGKQTLVLICSLKPLLQNPYAGK